MNSTPVINFETDEALTEAMRYWQRVLLMQHWTIKARLAPADALGDEDEDGTRTCGLCTHQIPEQCATIQIMRAEDWQGDSDRKFCQELFLVHELLHPKLWRPYSVGTAHTAEGLLADAHDHVLVDQMARSLLMAKYDINHDWFLAE